MADQLTSNGYEFEPSRYASGFGYSQLRVIISGKPTQRLFDVKLLFLPTFDGRFLHHKQITRHELEPNEAFQVCLGELRLETHQGEKLRAFSFGGNLLTKVEAGDLFCEFSSTAPIFKLEANPISASGVIADEIMDLLAEKKAKLGLKEEELYSRLAKYEPYPLFLSCMVSLQKRAEGIPTALRREGYRKVTANLNRAIQIIKDTDGWEGRSPSLEQLLSSASTP